MNRAPKLTRRDQRASVLAEYHAPESERFTLPYQGHTVPVPYVASWSSELPNLRVQPEPLIPGSPLALFRGSGKRGDGVPVLGKMDTGRQRLCILKGLCQVCARPLVKGETWLALLLERIELDGRSMPVVREPPACTACMALSLATCPGLRRAKPMIVEPGKTQLLATQTVPPIGGFGPLVEGGPELENINHADAVIGYLKIAVFTGVRQYTADAFLAAFSPGDAA